MTTEIQPVQRRVVATMMKGQSKEVIIGPRSYSYFDTAVPRMLQLALTYANEGDIVEFASIEFGFQLGIMHIRKGGRFEIVMNPMVKESPSLLKLMNDSTQEASYSNKLVEQAMKNAKR